MATSAVLSVLNQLGQLAANEAIIMLGLEEEMVHVKMNLQWLLEFLADADQKRRDTQHGLVRLWVSQLREAAHDLEDVLDEFAVNLDLQRMGFSGWKASPWLHCFISPKKQLFIRRDLASEITRINKRLEVISSNRIKYLDNVIMSSSSQQQSFKDVMINVLRTEVEAHPTGQDRYVEDLRPQLVDCNAQGMSVISIFGMGGLGKTTLAKRLYDDDKVASHFTLRAWLTISQTFSGIDLLIRLMDQLHLLESTKKINEDEAKTKIKNHLREKSIMIVLDDIWEISPWKYLQAIFPTECQRMVVLLTTRNKKVATDVHRDSQLIELQPLENEQSWQLFCKRTFADGNCPTEFQQFKEDVIQRCKGLPLSIVLLAGLLRRRNHSKQWRKVLNHLYCSMHEEDELQHGILALSYDDLPRRLKPCFLYFAGYPEDSQIQAKPLLRMWIAEGFIPQQKGRIMEDMAEEYLEEFIQRSLVQIVMRDEVGQVSIIQVHDMILDMARNESREINFLDQNISQQSSTLTRRLSLYEQGDIHKHNYNFQQKYSIPKLRSLWVYYIKYPSKYYDFLSAKFLRVLNLRGVEFPNTKCPKSIGNMIQLRYLCLARTNLEDLPSNISNLHNLQTLDVRGTFIKLPNLLWKIDSLRHVLGPNSALHPPSKQDVIKLNELQTLIGSPTCEWIINDGLGKLYNIRTLILFVDSDSCYPDLEMIEEKLICAIENLNHLTYLSLEEEFAFKKVLTAHSTSLQYLQLCRGKNKNGEYNEYIFLPNLSKLVLIGMDLTELDIQVIGLLSNLKSLRIEDDQELRQLVFKEGYFSCLEELELVRCYILESWEVKENWSTSILQFVKIHACPCPVLELLSRGLQIKELQLGNGERAEVPLSAGQIMGTVVKPVERNIKLRTLF